MKQRPCVATMVAQVICTEAARRENWSAPMRMYDDWAPELKVRRDRAAELTNEYNASYGQPREAREAILRRLFAHVGEYVHFEQTFRCEFGDGISIGDRFLAHYDCIMLDGGGITIGDEVNIGPRVSIYTSNHALHAEERIAGACYDLPVVIGNRVWIGGEVTITAGASIGSNSVIAAGSVVTGDIPSDVLAAGVPCRVVREITDADRTGFVRGAAWSI